MSFDILNIIYYFYDIVISQGPSLKTKIINFHGGHGQSQIAPSRLKND